MEHLILFGASEAQQQWQRIGGGQRGELVCRFAEGPLTLSEDTTFDEAFEQARARLQVSPGLAIRVHPAVRGVEVRVSMKTGKGLSLPINALLVGLEGSHEWTKLTDELAIGLEGWECLVVPAAGGLENKLSAFVESLQGLPADYRAAMLFTLMAPTLESRVARIESIEPLLQSLPPIGSTHGRRSGGSRRQRIRDALLLGAVIVLLFGFGFLSYRLSGVDAALAEQQQVLQDGFAALGVSSEPVARGAGSAAEKDAPAPAPEPGPGSGPAMLPPASGADESLDEKLSRFFAGVARRSEPLLLDAVTFQGAKPVLDQAARSQIESVVEILKQHARATAEISGHSDSQGNDQQKEKMSQDRATAIMNELVVRGIDQKRLVTLALLDKFPLSGESPSSPRNRRVEVRFIR